MAVPLLTPTSVTAAGAAAGTDPASSRSGFAHRCVALRVCAQAGQGTDPQLGLHGHSGARLERLPTYNLCESFDAKQAETLAVLRNGNLVRWPAGTAEMHQKRGARLAVHGPHSQPVQ